MIVNGTEVTIKDLEGVSEQEILAYMDYIHQDNPSEEIDTLELSPAEDGSVALEYTLRPQKFQRIRRITGYLVGTIDRWNNAKRAEEHDRVKHGLREASAS
ncbi:MAG: anaerobic ribonucleoside-triphosphate reductase [Negativicutes bacterium]